jgi:hypothetical protein
MEVKAGLVAQVPSLGPKRLKVIEPVGLPPPASTAVSDTVPPTATEAEAVVEIVGVTMPAVTITDSLLSKHAEMGTRLLLASPLYIACQR